MIVKWSFRDRTIYEGELVGVRDGSRGNRTYLMVDHQFHPKPVGIPIEVVGNWDEIQEQVEEMEEAGR